MRIHRVIVMAAALVAAAAAQETRPTPAEGPGRWACCSDASQLPAADPARGEVPMAGAAPGWDAFHLFTSDTWRLHCIGAARLTDQFGSPQVLVLDEKGRCVILQSDSGKWKPQVVVEDGRASSAWAHGDLDPREGGDELYVGGGGGTVYQVVLRGGRWATAAVASLAGAPLSKLVLGDLVPARPGTEMVAFTNTGPVVEVRAPAADEGAFEMAPIGDLGSRARDAVLLPGSADRPPRVLVVLQSGEVALVTVVGGGIERTALCREPMSIARLARRRWDGPEVVYVARVDGLILRFAEDARGTWTREMIYAGPQGPRGLAAGRFDADPAVETVAVFGYSKKVQLLSRRPGEPWRAETIYTDVGGGHWLTAGELDGRNATDELVGGGFSYHVFMVAREPGYGLDGVPADPDGVTPPEGALGPATPVRPAALPESRIGR
jgi:hypothetical protein